MIPTSSNSQAVLINRRNFSINLIVPVSWLLPSGFFTTVRSKDSISFGSLTADFFNHDGGTA